MNQSRCHSVTDLEDIVLHVLHYCRHKVLRAQISFEVAPPDSATGVEFGMVFSDKKSVK